MFEKDRNREIWKVIVQLLGVLLAVVIIGVAFLMFEWLNPENRLLFGVLLVVIVVLLVLGLLHTLLESRLPFSREIEALPCHRYHFDFRAPGNIWVKTKTPWENELPIEAKTTIMPGCEDRWTFTIPEAIWAEVTVIVRGLYSKVYLTLEDPQGTKLIDDERIKSTSRNTRTVYLRVPGTYTLKLHNKDSSETIKSVRLRVYETKKP